MEEKGPRGNLSNSLREFRIAVENGCCLQRQQSGIVSKGVFTSASCLQGMTMVM